LSPRYSGNHEKAYRSASIRVPFLSVLHHKRSRMSATSRGIDKPIPRIQLTFFLILCYSIYKLIALCYRLRFFIV
ncbi:MAG: hypothetical protein KJ857_03225, partial [Proteobacteria bacterium]|nr:hypothetical protein [Pseudomonadota bacterium]